MVFFNNFTLYPPLEIITATFKIRRQGGSFLLKIKKTGGFSGLPANKIQNDRQQYTQNNAGNQRKVKTKISFLNKNISGQAAESEQFAAQDHNSSQ